MEPARTSASAPILDWRTVATQNLKALVAQVRDMEDIKREAEKIVAALRAAQVENIPELPWRGARNGHTPLPDTSCSLCGRSFANTNQYRRQPDGTAVCRPACPENAE